MNQNEALRQLMLLRIEVDAIRARNDEKNNDDAATEITTEDRYAGRHQITLNQIGMPTLMACGARDFVHHDPSGMIMFRVGSFSGSAHKIIVTLMPSDTYTVEYGRIPMRGAHKYEWVSGRIITEVYAEQLSETVYNLVNR